MAALSYGGPSPIETRWLTKEGKEEILKNKGINRVEKKTILAWWGKKDGEGKGREHEERE